MTDYINNFVMTFGAIVGSLLICLILAVLMYCPIAIGDYLWYKKDQSSLVCWTVVIALYVIEVIIVSLVLAAFM